MEKLKKDLKINSEKTIVWGKLTAIEKRKTLARDVITQVKLGWIIPSQGSYCKPSQDVIEEIEEDKPMQLLLQQKEACEVCAMGSIMTAMVIRNNNHEGYWNDEDIIYRLKGVFSELQLRMMETAFEGKVVNSVNGRLTKGYSMGRGIPTKLGEKCISFGLKFKNNKETLLGIMENILQDSRGLFLGDNK